MKTQIIGTIHRNTVEDVIRKTIRTTLERALFNYRTERITICDSERDRMVLCAFIDLGFEEEAE